MHSPCKCKNQSSVQFFRINREKIGSFWFFENFGKLRLDFITTQTSDQSQSCAFNAEIKRQIRYIYIQDKDYLKSIIIIIIIRFSLDMVIFLYKPTFLIHLNSLSITCSVMPWTFHYHYILFTHVNLETFWEPTNVFREN